MEELEFTHAILIRHPKKRAEFFSLFDALIDLAMSHGWYDAARIHIQNKEEIAADLAKFLRTTPEAIIKGA